MSERILTKRRLLAVASAVPVLSAFASARAQAPQDVVLTNVSYDPTRELYKAINEAFARQWQASTGQKVTVRASHGGSGKQARSVIDGLEADVVTLALAGDIDAIARESEAPAGELAAAPAQQFLALHLDHRVRGAQGQSQGHQGLARSRQAGRLGHHAQSQDLGRRALELSRGLGLRARPHAKGDQAAARKFVEAIYRNVPVLDSGARGSTTTFAQRAVGDVAISWENEAFLILQEFGADKFEIVVPPFSILAEPPVALVDAVVDKRGTRKVAQAYLDFLYSPAAQKIIARNFYRPSKPDAADPADLARFPKIKLVTIDQVFGGWTKAQAEHFADGGQFDQIYRPSGKAVVR